MHHIHGIINVTSCALWSGAVIEPFARFDLGGVLDRVRAGAYTVFMAVPTIYVKLIQALEAAAPVEREAIVRGFAQMRLMVSGSAALPASVHQQWTALTGQKLLERYGMTETGMILSNPSHGERRPGAVGQPLPGVDVRLKTEAGAIVSGEDVPVEIQVRGPGVFQGYWNRPEATAESFDGDWFRTGDMAVLETGYYRIMGRLSVDVIKSGGYKLSALEIEAALLDRCRISRSALSSGFQMIPGVKRSPPSSCCGTDPFWNFLPFVNGARNGFPLQNPPAPAFGQSTSPQCHGQSDEARVARLVCIRMRTWLHVWLTLISVWAAYGETTDHFNSIVGTQAISGRYQFTGETKLLESAQLIQELGSNILKLALSEDGSFGAEKGNIPLRPTDVSTLTDLVTKEPSHKAVFEMPFAYDLLWGLSTDQPYPGPGVRTGRS